MSIQLTATTSLINEKVKFRGAAGSNPEIILDYTPPIGDREGYTSLELFLISLASCSGTAVSLLLGRMRKDVSGLKIDASGTRREEHPTYFEKIHLQFELVSKDAETSDFEKAIRMSEESLCPVWNMVKSSVEISYEYNISRS